VLRGSGPFVGTIDASNSVVGDPAFPFDGLVFEPVHGLVLVGRPSASRVAVVVLSPSFVSLSPGRLLETRSGQPVGTVDGQHQATGPVAAGTVYELPVSGRAGVAVDAESVVLNVTVTEPQGPGFVTVFPCGSARPTASNLNFTTGETIPNLVIAKVGAGGKVCFYVHATTQLVVDVSGFFPPDSGYVAQNPARLLETRTGEPVGTIDHNFEAIGARPTGSTTELQITGRAGIPPTATAVTLNVTVTQPSGPGFVTVYQCGTTRPTASNLNFVAGQTIANAVVAKIGAGGKVCVYTHTATQLVVDVNGYHSPLSTLVPLDPARILETRSGQPVGTIDGQHQGFGPFPAGGTLELQVAGRGGVPVDASAVVLNFTVTEAGEPGFITLYPCGTTRPTASNLNYTTGQTIANAVIVKLGTNGKVCVYNHGLTHMLADITAYIPS
jgi:hypothetical protein